jgi:hypothetical protein
MLSIHIEEILTSRGCFTMGLANCQLELSSCVIIRGQLVACSFTNHVYEFLNFESVNLREQGSAHISGAKTPFL